MILKERTASPPFRKISVNQTCNNHLILLSKKSQAGSFCFKRKIKEPIRDGIGFFMF